MSEAEDVFQELLAAAWRDIEFPVTRMRLSLAHDLVEHKYVGVRGGRIEDTGLAPLRFAFTAPLLRGISPGRAERWSDLYPKQFRLLVAAFQKTEIGILQHPEFDQIPCRAERMDVDWDAARRGGTDVEMSFVETAIENDDSSFLDGNSPVQSVDVGAAELDSATVRADLKTLLLANGLDLPPYLEDPTISLGELANKVKAVFDAPSLMSQRAAGQIDSIVFHADRIGRSASAARSALTWPVTQNVERIKAAAHDMKEALLAGTRDIAFFKVPVDTTLAGVARQIPEAKVGDLVRLNPELVRQPEIPKGTIVRYYVPRRAAA